jgi:hypothetical protein
VLATGPQVSGFVLLYQQASTFVPVKASEHLTHAELVEELCMRP